MKTDWTAISKAVQAPDWLTDYLPLFYSEEDLAVLKQAESLFACKAEVLQRTYHRGIVSKTEEGSYRIAAFSEFFEIWLIERSERLNELPPDKKEALRDWFFSSYYESKPETWTPAADFTLPLTDMLEYIDRESRDIYLCDCECRKLGQGCDRPVKTCFSFHTGINSFADRGIAEKISRETARQIVLDADRAGLMHTVNGMGCCQCCGDDCIMFRYTKEHHLEGVWPIAAYRVSLNPDTCIGCGTCTGRCHFDVFSLTPKSSGTDGQSMHSAVLCDRTRCVGCGLCVNTCPTGALTLEKK